MNPIIKNGDLLLKRWCLERADFRFEMCDTQTDHIDPHHILPKSVYPQHRHNPENIAVLCRSECHNFAETKPRAFMKAARTKHKLQNRIMFYDKNKGINPNPPYVDIYGPVEKLKELVGE